MGSGLDVLYRNRPPLAANGVCYGGIALVWRSSFASFKRVAVGVESRHELMVCVRSIKGHRRRMIALVCYIPPNISKKEAEDCLDCITCAISSCKRKYSNPYFVVDGDFNQWDVKDCLD